MLYSWPGVRKYWLSILSTFKQCCVINSSLRATSTRTKRWMFEITQKKSTRYKNIKLFRREEGLLEIRPNQRKSCQFIWLKIYYKISFLPNNQNNYLVSLYQKTSVEILTARYMSYFYKKIKGVYASQSDLRNLYVSF